MLTVAVWMVLNPGWWIECLQGIPEQIRGFAGAIRARRSPLLPQTDAPAAEWPRNDRRNRAAVRLSGALLAAVATAHLYEQVMFMLSGWSR
jgi:hypothetical protein